MVLEQCCESWRTAKQTQSASIDTSNSATAMPNPNFPSSNHRAQFIPTRDSRNRAAITRSFGLTWVTGRKPRADFRFGMAIINRAHFISRAASIRGQAAGPAPESPFQPRTQTFSCRLRHGLFWESESTAQEAWHCGKGTPDSRALARSSRPPRQAAERGNFLRPQVAACFPSEQRSSTWWCFPTSQNGDGRWTPARAPANENAWWGAST